MVTPEQVGERLASLGLAAAPDEIGALVVETKRTASLMDRLRAGLSREDRARRFKAFVGKAVSAGPFTSDRHAFARPCAGGQPLAAVTAALERATASQPRLNAFAALFEGAARHRAERLERSRRRERSPLFGMPFAYKDVFVAPDRAPRAGAGPDFSWAGPPSRSLARLARAGAVAIGATNLDPYSYAATGLNARDGRVRHPIDDRFAVGGSSSGSAVAVAAGVVPFALGTDTGGSVRIPASLCGVLGLKPTHGLIRDPGVVPLSPSQDTVGLLAATPALMAAVLAVLRSERASTPEPSRPDSGVLANWNGLRVGLDPNGLCAGLAPEVAAALEEFLDEASAKGAIVGAVPFPSVDDLNGAASVVTGWEAAAMHAASLARRQDLFPQIVRRRLLSAALVCDADYRTALRVRARLLATVLNETFRQADVLVCPTLRHLGSRVDHLNDDDLEEAGAMSLDHLRLNRPFSYLGLPALSFPVGRDRNGISIGLQLIGRPFMENILLQLADAANWVHPDRQWSSCSDIEAACVSWHVGLRRGPYGPA